MSEDLAAAFRRFAEEDCSGRVASPSPLYEQLSLEIADDPELLALAASAREEQPAPLLLLAAVQYLLFERPAARLAAYYPSLGGETIPVDDATYSTFKSFCQRHEDAIRELLQRRRVQTNTVRRSGCLLPAFEYVSRLVDRTPLGLVEIGASAGLNLLWDRYGYEFGSMHVGHEESAVRIDCELRGNTSPPLPDEGPPVGSRRGIDLHPLDVTDPADKQWLRALIWPEHEHRRETVDAAIDVAVDQPPAIHEGDVLDELRTVVGELPDDQSVCLYNSYVLYQLPDADRAMLYDLVDDLGNERDLYWLSCEWAMDIATPVIHLYRWEDGVHSADLLARFHGHGAWLHWLHRQP